MLTVCEIFHSIQGESTHAGRPCTFIRLTGCNLRCNYCDTQYAYHEGDPMTPADIVEQVTAIGCPLIEITGGEPLEQNRVSELCIRLLASGFEVLVETNGTHDIDLLPEGIKRIMDIKCPGSGEADKTDWMNLTRLRSGDEIKFVIRDGHDYTWAKGILRKHPVLSDYPVLFSPVFPELPRKTLAEWILEDRLNVRLQLQLHQVIWPESARGK